MSNPKVALFFLAFLPQFVSATDSDSVSLQLFCLGLLFLVVAAFVFFGIALVSGRIAKLLNQHPRVQHWLNIISSLVFVLMAINLAVSSNT